MGKTLRRYVLGEILGVLFLGVLLTTFVLATVEMIDLVDLAFAKGVPATRVLSVFGYMVPSYLELTLPMALLLSIVAAFARLSRDGEILGLRAAGLSLGQLTRPLFGFAVVMALVSFVLAGWTSPWANRALERSITDMAKTRMTAALTPGVFSPWVDDIVVYVGEIERRSGRVKDVMLADERDRERPRTIFAADGQLETDNDARMARFRMHDGTILADYANPKSFDRTDFKTFDLNVSLGTEDVEASASFMDEPRRLDWDTLLDARSQPESDRGVAREREIEIHRRLALPFSCVLLPLIGVPLGVQRSRGVRSRGLVVGLGVILVYYFLVTAGVTLVHQNVLSAAPALWAPNVALLMAGLIAFRSAGGERLGPPRRPKAAQEKGPGRVSILDRYLLERFLRTLPLCVAAAAALFLLVDFFIRVGDLAEYGSGISKAASYFAFKLPRILSEVYPAATLVAVLIGMGALAEGREILAMHTCGLASGRILLPIAVAGAVLSTAVLGWNETVVPPTSSRARMIQDVGIKKRLQSGSFNATSIWYQNSQGFVNVDYFDATHNVLYGITLHEMDAHFKPSRIVKVPQATWTSGDWALGGGTVMAFTDSGDAVIREIGPGDLRLEAEPDELRRKRRRSYEFSYNELREQIYNLERKGLDATEYVVDLHYKLAAPFAGLVSIVMGFPLAVRAGKRGGGILRNVGFGLAVSFAYWSATALSVSAGHSGTMPPLLAAWAPNALFGFGGAALYLGREV